MDISNIITPCLAQICRRAGIAILAVGALLPGLVAAQDGFPNKPIRMVVPYAAGGNTDVAARTLAERLTQIIGQPVVVENRTGAGARVGTEAVFRAPADGYTLLMTSNATHGALSASEDKLPFDPVKNFTAVALVGSVPYILLTPPDDGYATFQQFMQAVKANPNKFSYGSAGQGASNQIVALELAKAMGVNNLVHIPYKGANPAVIDLTAGRINLLFDAQSSVGAFLKDGRIKALAVTGPNRLSSFPNVPTLGELGFPQFAEWIGMSIVVAAGDTPRPVINRLNEAILRALATPDTQNRLSTVGFTIAPPVKADGLVNYLHDANDRWAPPVRALTRQAN